MRHTLHFPALDFLRGIAAVCVFIGHLELGGHVHPFHFELAVDFFFLLSGFVVAHAYEEKLGQGMSFSTFAQIRLVRLYPLILLGLIVGALMLSARAFQTHNEAFLVWGPTSFVLSLFLIPNPLLDFLVGEAAFPFNVPAWSLSAEIASNAVYAAARKNLTNAILALVILSATILVLLFGVDGGPTFNSTPIGFLRVMFSFPTGIALYRLFRAGFLKRVRAPLSMITALLLITFWLPRGELSRIIDAVAVLLLFPFLVAAGANVTLSGTLKAFSLSLGRLSYPLYILHHPLMKPFANVARALHFTGWAFVCWTVFEIAVIIAVAFLALKFYDEPVRKMIGRWLSRKEARAIQTAS